MMQEVEGRTRRSEEWGMKVGDVGKYWVLLLAAGRLVANKPTAFETALFINL